MACECGTKEHWEYTKRTFSNGTQHYCLQCFECGQIGISHNRHKGKCFLPLDEIPKNEQIHDWID